MTFSRLKNTIKFSYKIEENILPAENEHKDLGILFSSNFTFHSHINNIINLSYKSLGFVMRNSCKFKVKTIIILYNSIVRSKLEYAAVIWNPVTNKYILLLEKIQNKFLKWLYYRLYNDYPTYESYRTMLQYFHFTSLQIRRNCQSLNLLYKIINNKLDCVGLFYYITLYAPKLKTKFRNLFYIPRTNTESHKNSPVFQMLQLYNKLHPHPNVDIFNMNFSRYRIICYHILQTIVVS